METALDQEAKPDSTPQPNGVVVPSQPEPVLQPNGVEVSSKPENSTNDPQNSGPSLYCPKNGRSHATLLDFEIYECTVCQADLRAPKVDPADPASTKDENKDDKTNNTEETKEEKSSSIYAQYLLQFQDLDGYSILQEEKKKDEITINTRRTEADKYLVLKAISRLYTNSDVRDILEEEKKDLLSYRKYQWSYLGTSLHIYSDVIIGALKSVALYPNTLAVSVPCLLEEPYFMLGHHLSLLKEHASKLTLQEDTTNGSNAVSKRNETGAEDLEHFNILFDWLKSINYEARLDEESERNARGVCTFQMLWTILRPSTTVYMTSQRILGAYVIDSIQIVPLIKAKENGKPGILSAILMDALGYTVRLWNLQYDGRFVARKMITVTIPFFAGERDITSLIVIPIEFYKEAQPGATRERLERLGQFWYESLRGRQVLYKGRSVEKPEKQVEGRAYIDPFGQGRSVSRGGSKYDPSEDEDWLYYNRDRIISDDDEVWCPCDICHGTRPHPAPDFPWKNYDVIDPKIIDSLEDPDSPYGPRHRYFVCDRKIWAVMLKTRNWELLDIAHCTLPTFNDNVLEKLVMPTERKDLIRALVMKFKGSKMQGKANLSWRADFVEGKGEGTIFLLHGSPGVGKTFTAECIAEYTERPLISLTCADIGTDEVDIEGKLELWLSRAERWGAVLLLDEADIFLESRSINDLKRNSLVSVFLRCLEYYRGILFLTTNRVGHFDDAFISRIHIVIRYEALSESDRKQIWTQFFDKLKGERRSVKISPNARKYVLGNGPDALYKQAWNGREIRNVFQTAVALAEYRAQDEATAEDEDPEPKLEDIDFEQVCEMTKDFKKYLENVHGANEEQRAFQLRARVNTSEF